MASHEEPGDDALWEPAEQAVPPVIGRVDPRTGQPLMRYDTSGEIVDDEPAAAGDGLDYRTEDGVDVSISFD